MELAEQEHFHRNLFTMAASISGNLLGIVIHCWSWVVAHVQNGLCPHQTWPPKQSGWIQVAYWGQPLPGQPQYRKSLWVLLAQPPPCQGPFRPGAVTASPWHCLIYHITCGSTPGKSGERRRRRWKPVKFFWMEVPGWTYNQILSFEMSASCY